MKLKLNIGDGFTFAGNDLSVNCGSNVSIINTGTSTEKGLFVGSLQGADGADGGSSPDGWTVIPDYGSPISGNGDRIDDFVDGNRSVVECIFSFGLYKPANHGNNGIVWSNSIKTVDDICDAINFPISGDCVGGKASKNQTSFRPNPSELLSLVDGPAIRQVYTSNTDSGKTWVEAGIRKADNTQKVRVLFVINKINYIPSETGIETYWVMNMELSCIYSSVDEFQVGQQYSGSTTYND